MRRWITVTAALWALAAGCNGSGASAPKTEALPCEDVHDCPDGQVCVCRGVDIDPCMPGMTELECDEARCGDRVCVPPEDIPPPPA